MPFLVNIYVKTLCKCLLANTCDQLVSKWLLANQRKHMLVCSSAHGDSGGGGLVITVLVVVVVVMV